MKTNHLITCLDFNPARFIAFAAISLPSFISWSAPGQTGADQNNKRIEEGVYVNLGGIEQWITVRGNNDEAPVLLLLHGGPGDVQSPLVETYRDYETDFILVQWDQRGAGKTYEKYKEQTPSLTLDQLIDDGIELASYLKTRFHRNGIIVLGHSLGTAIATEMVIKRPDLFIAYVGTGQIASWAESVQWQFDYLKNKAAETGNGPMANELVKIGTPDPSNTVQYFRFTRSLRKYLHSSDSVWLSEIRTAFNAFPKNDRENIIGGMNFAGQALLPFQVKEQLSTTFLNFTIPYFVIQGRHDVFTPTDPVIAYFEMITAPQKKIVIIEDAGHFALVTHKQEVIKTLRDTVLVLLR
jgi:pimeloyl-ACP methyl ester carboxylesterase